jgi:hypothetical protein
MPGVTATPCPDMPAKIIRNKASRKSLAPSRKGYAKKLPALR